MTFGDLLARLCLLEPWQLTMPARAWGVDYEGEVKRLDRLPQAADYDGERLPPGTPFLEMT